MTEGLPIPSVNIGRTASVPLVQLKRYYGIPFDREAFKRAAQHSVRDELLDRTARAIQDTAARWRAEGVINIRLERLEGPLQYGLRLVGDKVKS